MATEDVDSSSLSVGSQAKSAGLVRGLAATQHRVCIHQTNEAGELLQCHNDGIMNTDIGIIIRPHHNTTYVHVPYHYRWSSVVCLSVGPSVCYDRKPCKIC